MAAVIQISTRMGAHDLIEALGNVEASMDPDARLGKDPVSFLLAMAPDAAQVGLLTDNWIIGGTL